MVSARTPTAARSAPRRSLAPLLLAAVVSVGNLFLHKPISDVCDSLFEWVGRGWYEWISLAAVALLCAVAAIPALRRLRVASSQTWLPLSFVGLTAATVAAQQWLLVSNVELVHFPQFALIAALLLAGGVGPMPAWLIATLAGVADETYQHLVIYAGVPHTYFDVNDIVLNAIGAAWGVCLFGADRLAARGPRFATARPYALAALLCAIPIAAALYLDPPDRVPLRKAATHRRYRVLSVGEGLAAIAVVAALVELGSRRRTRPAASRAT